MSEIFPFLSRKPKNRWNDSFTDKLWMLAFLLAAVLIFGLNLGGVALRDWDEGIAAQVSREIWRGNLNWLYPTIDSMPYFNKPPLVHWLIGLCFAAGGVSELTARLVPAMLTAASVPLLYAIGRELFPPTFDRHFFCPRLSDAVTGGAAWTFGDVGWGGFVFFAGGDVVFATIAPGFALRFGGGDWVRTHLPD